MVSRLSVGATEFNPRGFSPAASGLSTPLSSTTSLSSLASAVSSVSLASPPTPATDILTSLSAVTSIGSVKTLAGDLASLAYDAGPASLQSYCILDKLKSLSKSKSSALVREASLFTFTTLVKKFGEQSGAEAYFVNYFTFPYDLLADKEATVRKAAQTAADVQLTLYPVEAHTSVLIPLLSEYLNSTAKWQSKIGVLKLFEKFASITPSDALLQQFVSIIPVLTNCMHDMKAELSASASKTITVMAKLIDNQDIVSRLPLIISTMAEPTTVPKTVLTLSHVTFVAEVTEPVLAMLVPILQRALNQGSSSQDLLRQTVIVVENLTRLVHNPREIRAFLPTLLPSVKKVVDTAALPEVRSLASKALSVLENAEKEEGVGRVTPSEIMDKLPSGMLDPMVEKYVASLVSVDVNTQEWERIKAVVVPYYQDSKLAEDAAAHIAEFYENLFNPRVVDDSGEDGIEIVNAKFSLAYGGKMLLNKTYLRLYKGHRYGLCGRNGAGKSTLMRAIANGKLEGFPDKSELRTCFVEHKLQGEEGDMDLVSFIAKDPELQHVARDDVAQALEDVGFDETRRAQNVGALSGGWKMKLELARAMLMKADILLLDEPTNHLDVANVKWLAEYLTSHTDITSLIVSHDSGFLDTVCTDIIHYEDKKLVYYKGNLAEFVKVRPEGKAYYTLTASNVTMRFPPPGILTGVKSNTRAIVRMQNVTYSYPGAKKPSLSNVSCALSLSSRVAILGANGAGKSTLIKLLTGELIPQEGRVEKHPNLRIGYIAQHALAHVEMHLEKTPNQYIQWRYANGDDREVLMKQTRVLTEEDKTQMSKPIDVGDGKGARNIECIVGRQKLKKSFQYEVKWVAHLPKYNSMISREKLLELGFQKMVQEFDDHEASREGLGYRQLSPPVIRQHFEDVGLDGDIADHVQMGGLSGGQLVKVVIAGAMWNNPHLLVLDEPTNYLDRDSLGGLAVAIRDWTGGVIMISHNEEFVGALCPEQWNVADGRVVQKGSAAVASDRFEDSRSGTPSAAASEYSGDSRAPSPTPQASAVTDDSSPANIKVKTKKKKLTRNQIKEREQRRRLRHLAWLSSPKGTPHPPDTDDEDE
ncbi:P-loop containing nucleoside triphosphate hydrolase protein [Lipomyces kononenkoae]|uniref:P-loop containing nucleoside triphosphate hydrolase protein n=1 Tax=Lipomyces kononenkoae TaxID=34357 RepID=A0ACC3STE7_LIPKO